MLDFKRGDTVMVRNYDTDGWRKAVYLETIKGAYHEFVVKEVLAPLWYEPQQQYSTSSYRQIKAMPSKTFKRTHLPNNMLDFKRGDRVMGREDWRDLVYTNEPIKKHNKLNIIYDIFTVLVGVMATIALGVIIYGIIKTT